MEFADLITKSVAELQDILKEAEEKMFDLRLKARSHQLKQVHEIKAVRKTIARLRTLLFKK